MVDLSKFATDDLATADDPPCKEIKLDFEKKNNDGRKLIDLENINAAQRVLKQQFPNIHGLESTLYQMKERRLNEDQNLNNPLPTKAMLDCCCHCGM